MSRRHGWPRAAAALAVGLLVLTGCNDHRAASAPPPSPTTAPAAAPAPSEGTCHHLGFDAAAQPTGGGTEVPCRRAHTAITYAVGSYRQVSDGHLLAVDSTHVQAQLARRCPTRLGAYLGGDHEEVRLSRLKAVWFGPSLTQAARGAHWFRCDVVAPENGDTLASLPGSLRGALADAAGRKRWGICGSTSPSRPAFARVPCTTKHSWRAIRTVDLPGSRYLAARATAAGNAACKDAASERAAGALKYTWSFQWPTRAQWTSGQHYGYCWVPDAG